MGADVDEPGSDPGTRGPRPDRPATAPRPLRTACVILAAEALGLVGIGVFFVYSTLFGHPVSVGGALLDALATFVAAAALLAGARGLLRMNPSARTPIVVIQLLAIPVGYTLGVTAGRFAYGGPILIAAVAVIYLLFTPPARAALDRDLDA